MTDMYADMLSAMNLNMKSNIRKISRISMLNHENRGMYYTPQGSLYVREDNECDVEDKGSVLDKSTYGLTSVCRRLAEDCELLVKLTFADQSYGCLKI